MGFILFLCVVGWLFYEIRSMYGTEARETVRENEKVAFRRSALALAPDSAGAHEALGDALREAGQYTEALHEFETARQLWEAGISSGGGLIGGSGLDTKIRLVTMDIEEDRKNSGGTYVSRLAERESFCRQCGTLNAADVKNCVACGRDLPVNTIVETWQRDDIRKPLLRELGQAVIMITVVVIALAFTGWMPLEVKGVLLLSTIIVLVWKGLRAITDK